MKIGKVIGRVVLSRFEAAYRGGRWLIVAPCDRTFLEGDQTTFSRQPSLVCYDNLGAGVGDLIGYTEGGEATAPFDRPMPIDAYNCCLIDRIHLESPDNR